MRVKQESKILRRVRGIDSHVLIRQIRRPKPVEVGMVADGDPNGECFLAHNSFGLPIGLIPRALTRFDDKHVIKGQIDLFGLKGNTGPAGGGDDPSPIGVLTEKSGFNQQRGCDRFCDGLGGFG